MKQKIIFIKKIFKVYQIDFNSIFLNSILVEEVYIEQLEGFIDANNKNMVCRLQKALYGLKQAPRAWFSKLSTKLQALGFCPSKADIIVLLL